MGDESPKPASTPTGAVFLSYASQDAEAAQRICDALREAGIEVWFDKSELRGGDAWDHQIREQIHNCRLFIPVISANSERRDEGYFRREWSLAADRTRDMAHKRAFLVPVVIDGTAERGASVPEKFHELQWTRLPGGETPPAFVERIHRLLSPEVFPARAAATQVSRGTPAMQSLRNAGPAPWRSKPALWAMGAVLAVALAYFVVDKLWLAKRVAAGTVSALASSENATEKSIAVLPFVDLSEKHDQEYFADGMASEVLDLLAKIPGLKVIGRTSSFQFKGKSQDLRTIGSTLGAAYVVEGSVRKSGDRVRVTAQLIDARDGTQRWSSSYDRKSGDVLELQDALAVSLARALQLTVSSDFGSRAGTRSTDAYDLYLRGLHALDQQSQESTEEAAGDFQRALDLDPAFAQAALGLAKVYQIKGEVAWLLPTHIAFERARQAAELALKLDPKLGAAHAVLADVHVIYDWDWTGADLEIKQARDLGNRVEAIQAAARLAAVRGEWDRATELFQTGLAADPLNANLHLLFAWGVGLRSGRFAEAGSLMRRALEISPKIGSGRWFLGLSLLFESRLDDALTVMQEETLDDGQLEGTAIVCYAMGKKAESDAALKRAIEHNAEEWPSAIARVYAFRGERDEAMKWFERAYSVKDEDLYLIRGDPLTKNLEGDPRYKAFLRKMNLPE
jgi:TolB-like protein